MTFFITIIIGDLSDVWHLLATILAILLFYWGCIYFWSRSATFILLLPFFPVLLFFFSSFFGLLGLFRFFSFLFGLGIGFFLTLTLEGRDGFLRFFQAGYCAPLLLALMAAYSGHSIDLGHGCSRSWLLLWPLITFWQNYSGQIAFGHPHQSIIWLMA